MKRQAKFTLAPTLKFQAVEAHVGSLDFALEYSELQPMITASGLGETAPSWDYSIAQGVSGLQGARWMHLLVKAPKGMSSAQAILDMEAHVNRKGFTWLRSLTWRPPAEQEKLTVQLWK